MSGMLSSDSLYREKCRLSSFKDWPFKDSNKCSPTKMARAGFYHCPTENDKDLVKCFVCGKELNGWEPDDDPWNEHVKHSGLCPFILRGSKDQEITVAEALQLERDKMIFLLKKRNETRSTELHETAANIKQEIARVEQEN